MLDSPRAILFGANGWGLREPNAADGRNICAIFDCKAQMPKVDGAAQKTCGEGEMAGKCMGCVDIFL